MDCVFIDIFRIRIKKEKKLIAIMMVKVDCAFPIQIKENKNKIKDTNNGCRLSNLETNHPEIGNPIKELIGIAKSIVPSCASFKSKNILMVGILEAQVAKQRPDKKK
jgi:hypothetical protein